jgi:GH24 family phage-related lysozyme (muramidase)/uncharacterized protein YvpB
MPWIIPTQATKLKLRPIDSSQLAPGEWRDRVAGESGKLGIVSARKVPGDTKHWEVRFAGELTIGGTPRKSCFIFADHWEGVGAVYQEAKAIAQTQRLSALPEPSNTVLLPVPYLSQRDNAENPDGACNVTSFAMMFGYFGITKRTGAAQFEDELYRYMEDSGLSRHSPIDLRTMARAYGLIDDFEPKATIDQVKKHLSSGRPVVTHGWLSASGHIIALIGYDEKGFIVHDPFGEWTSSGYDRNDPNGNNAKGKQLTYSYGLIERTCLTDDQFWVHFVDRAGWHPPTPKANYSDLSNSTKAVVSAPKKYSPQDFRLNSIATAMIKSYEGLDLEAYPDSENIPTIGIGTTVYPDGRAVRLGDRCTEAEALAYFQRDIDRFIAALRDLVDVSLTGRQIAALTSFIYNAGIGSETDPDYPGFSGSTLRKLINQSAPTDKIQGQLRRWTNGGTPGLIKRRESECELWQGGKWEKHR